MGSKIKVDFTVVLLGGDNVGKSRLLARFTNREYHNTATIGAAFANKKVEVDGETFTLGYWDTAGQERYLSLSKIYLRNCSFVILVYDITYEPSFDVARDTWIPELLQRPQIQWVLVGNQKDKEKDRKISYDTGKALAEEHGAIFYETSAITGENVDIAFQDTMKDMIRSPGTTSTSLNLSATVSQGKLQTNFETYQSMFDGLMSFKCRDRGIDTKELKTVLSYVVKMPKLQSLDLAGNNLSNRDVKSLFSFVKKSDLTIETLNISGNPIGVLSTQQLQLLKDSKVQKLILSAKEWQHDTEDPCTETNFINIIKSLAELPNLRVLDMRGIQLSASLVPHVRSLIAPAFSSIYISLLPSYKDSEFLFKEDYPTIRLGIAGYSLLMNLDPNGGYSAYFHDCGIALLTIGSVKHQENTTLVDARNFKLKFSSLHAQRAYEIWSFVSMWFNNHEKTSCESFLRATNDEKKFHLRLFEKELSAYNCLHLIALIGDIDMLNDIDITLEQLKQKGAKQETPKAIAAQCHQDFLAIGNMDDAERYNTCAQKLSEMEKQLEFSKLVAQKARQQRQIVEYKMEDEKLLLSLKTLSKTTGLVHSAQKVADGIAKLSESNLNLSSRAMSALSLC